MSGFDFSDILDVFGDNEFEEAPVTLEQFVTDEHYLNLPPLS